MLPVAAAVISPFFLLSQWNIHHARCSFLLFILVAVFVSDVSARYLDSGNEAVKISCSCTKRRSSNAVELKSATCQRMTSYTACCNKAHPSMDCLFDAKATKKVGRRNAAQIIRHTVYTSRNVTRRVPFIIRHLYLIVLP